MAVPLWSLTFMFLVKGLNPGVISKGCVSKQQIMCPGPVKLNSSKESDQTTKK